MRKAEEMVTGQGGATSYYSFAPPLLYFKILLRFEVKVKDE